MDDLIEALTIFKKYTDTRSPTICEHDILLIVDVKKNIKEAPRLQELGFHWSTEYGCWGSYRFGSA